MLPGLGWPMRRPGMSDEEYAEIMASHRKQDRIGAIVAVSLLAVGLGAMVVFWVIYLARWSQ